MSNLNHKEMTKWIRTLLKRNKLPASACKLNGCENTMIIRISATQQHFDSCRKEGVDYWATAQARKISEIAKHNGLTEVRCSEIDLDINEKLTKKEEFFFEFHGSK